MKHLIYLFLLLLPISLIAQQTVNIYDPQANAKSELATAIASAKQQNKHVLVQVGGNWCLWCVKLYNFINSNAKIDSIIKADYVFIHVNYSKENRNLETMALLGYPQRFGFPVFVILNGNGQNLHIQDTGYLEKGNGYDEENIIRFLLNWNVAAIDPQKYTLK